jgi:hypothetical protein
MGRGLDEKKKGGMETFWYECEIYDATRRPFSLDARRQYTYD